MSLLNSTTTTNMSNETDVNSYAIYEFTDEQVAALSFMYGLISLLCLVGNLMFITVMVRNRSLQTVTNVFLINRACADLVIGLLSVPFQFQAILLQRWDLPSIMCMVSPFAKTLSVNVSIFTMVTISLDRYMAYVHPLRHILLTRVTARFIILAIWVVALIIALPELLMYTTRIEVETGNTICAADRLEGYVDIGLYWFVLTLIQFFVPLSVISVAYVIAIYTISWSQPPGQQISSQQLRIIENKRKVIRTLITVVLLFAVSWLPYQSYFVISYFRPSVNSSFFYINVVYLMLNALAMSNCCQNPYMYALVNDRFKRAYKVLWSNICPCCCTAVESPKTYTTTYSTAVTDGDMTPAHARRTAMARRKHFQKSELLSLSRDNSLLGYRPSADLRMPMPAVDPKTSSSAKAVTAAGWTAMHQVSHRPYWPCHPDSQKQSTRGNPNSPDSLEMQSGGNRRRSTSANAPPKPAFRFWFHQTTTSDSTESNEDTLEKDERPKLIPKFDPTAASISDNNQPGLVRPAESQWTDNAFVPLSASFDTIDKE